MQLYLARMGEFYKIGLSANPERRIRGLMPTKLPIDDIGLVYACKNSYAPSVERLLHEHFAAVHVRGEWFRLSDEQVSEAKALMTGSYKDITTPGRVVEVKPPPPDLENGNYSRSHVAKILDVSLARVSQLTKLLEVTPKWKYGIGIYYNQSDLDLMLKRNKTPGPKRNGGGKR